MAQAQNALPPGLIANLGVTQRLEYSDNPDLSEDKDSDFFGRTILDFGVISETSIQSLAFTIGTNIEEGRKDQSTLDVTNSFARLNYNRATRNASVGARLSYREADTSSEFFDDSFPNNGSVINQDDGTRRTYRLGLSGAVGLEAPIGAGFDFDYRELEFSGTDDPDLTDESELDLSGNINFQIDPRIAVRLTAVYSDFDAQGNGVDRETKGFGVGTTLDFSRTLQGDFEFRYDTIDRTGDEESSDDGITFLGRLTQEVTNGSWGLSFDSDVSSNDDGRRNFFRVDRDMALPRGALAYSLGGTNSESSDFDPLLDLRYTHDLPSSRVTLGLTQRFNTNNDNEEEINSTLRAGYRYQINNLSSFGANLSFLNRNEIGPNADDGQRGTVELNYEYALTRDWGLVTGYRYTRETSDSDDDRSANTIFVGLQRNFSWNP